MNIRWKNRAAIEEALREDSGSTVVPPAEKSAPPNNTHRKLNVLTKALTAYRELLFAEDLPAQEKPDEVSPGKVKAFLAATAELRARVASEGNAIVEAKVVRPSPKQGWAIWQWTALAATLCVLATVTALFLIPPGRTSRDVLLVDGLSAVDGPFVVMRSATGEEVLDAGIIRQEALDAVNVARGKSAAPVTDAAVVKLETEWIPGNGLPPELKALSTKVRLVLVIQAGKGERQLRLVLYDFEHDKEAGATVLDLPDNVPQAKALIRKAIAGLLSRR